MTTRIERALGLRFPALAVSFAKERPATAVRMRPLCSMLLVAQAARGKIAAFSTETCRCPGAGEGFALSEPRPEFFPGGRECALRFLSCGNQDWGSGRAILEELKQDGAPGVFVEEFAKGEGFKKTPELVGQYYEALPKVESEGDWVVMRPLGAWSSEEHPKTVTLLVDADQLSALVVLANYARPGLDSVRIPFGAGCSSLALYPFHECGRATPRAVVGLTDISARFYMRKLLGRDILAFSIPWSLFVEMEDNVEDSFLSRSAWKRMAGHDAG